MTTNIIILAAGKGTRMKSARPKVLHELAGNTLLGHVLDNVSTLNPDQISVVIGHGAEQVQQEITARADHHVDWIMQTEQLGTGHAVQQALPGVRDDDTVVIAYGDVPLTRPETFQALASVSSRQTLGLLTVHLDDPTGYGRITRGRDGLVTGIVEHKDATDEQRLISEINSGMLAVNGAVLRQLLSRIDNNNQQQEYYLTDIFALAVQDGLAIETVHPAEPWEVSGVNSRVQLAELERIYQQQRAVELMDAGVTLRDPARLDVRGRLATGTDIEIDINAVFVGDNMLGDDVRIGPNCTIVNSTIGPGTVVEANSVIENAVIGENCMIGPYARLRPGSNLSDHAKVGNFVELKNARIGHGSKVNHLSYVGDAEVGTDVNVGAGTITCNYDGANKHQTVIGDGAFIGSNAALVAPVEIGTGATVGAGATISQNVSDNVLVVARARQVEIETWTRPQKKKALTTSRPPVNNASRTKKAG